MSDIWNYLKCTDKPILMYGIGNGADKILDVFDIYGIKVSDIFSSDDFFKQKEFHGFNLKRYSDIVSEYEEGIIILAFAIFRDDMLNFIKNIPSKFEVLAPSVPVFGNDYFSLETLEKYENEINTVKELLADEMSVKVLEDSINYRLTGKISYLFNCQTDRDEVFSNIINFDSNETYIDLGAYRGDTIEEFLNQTNNNFEKILALEPDEKNYNKLSQYVSSLSNGLKENIIIENKASWSEQKVLSFPKSGGRNSSLLLEDIESVIFATDIDSLVNEYALNPTYIKMDVEGAEAETLVGLKNTLVKFRPKLAVSAYHKTADLFTLPILINKLNPEYKIYLRHHPYIPDWETNIYCI